MSLHQTLNDIARTPGDEPSTCTFFLDLLWYYKEHKFVDDFSTISFEEPDITEKFVHEELCHVR